MKKPPLAPVDEALLIIFGKEKKKKIIFGLALPDSNPCNVCSDILLKKKKKKSLTRLSLPSNNTKRLTVLFF